jgi:hypothetical protein
MKKSNFDSPTMSLMDLKEFVNLSPALKSAYNTLIVQKLLPGIENVVDKQYAALSAPNKQKWNQVMNSKIDNMLHSIGAQSPSTQISSVVPSPSSTQSPLSQSGKPPSTQSPSTQISSVVPSPPSTQISSVVPSPPITPSPIASSSTMIGSPFR